MSIFIDGWLVLFYNWRIVVLTLLVLLPGYVIVLSILKIIFKDTLTAAEYFSFSLAGCLLPVLLGAILIFSTNIFQRTDFSILILLILASLVFIPAQRQIRVMPASSSKSTLRILILFFFVSIFLRLVFISKAVTPLYFDSAEHYRVIRYLLGVYRASQSILDTSLSVSKYYHLGFHLIAAVLPTSIEWYVMDSMMILGQIILAIIPIPVFFIIRHEAESDKAGLFSVILAGMGWYMPAYAVNWGKYPALTSLIIIQFILCLGYINSRFNNALAKKWVVYALSGLGIAAAGLIHTRSIVIIGIAFISWALANWRLSSSKPAQFLLLFLSLGGILAEFKFIQSVNVLMAVFDPYVQHGYMITTLVILLSVFAFKKFPGLALSCILSIFFLLLCLLVPINILPSNYGYQTILDRPFVEMILYLPLAILGGLGFAGVEQYLFSAEQRREYLRKLAVVLTSLLFGVILLYTFKSYAFYPSDCCQIVSNDDLVAFDWIKKNLPSDSQILISTMELNVFASAKSEGFTGTDAGIWIPSLVNRPILGLPNSLDFGKKITMDMLCKRKVKYIYVGGTQQSFSKIQLEKYQNWYQNVFFLPKSRIYRITGCPVD